MKHAAAAGFVVAARNWPALLRVLLRDLGVLGLVGAALLAAAPAAWWLAVARPQQEAREIKAEITRLRTRRIAVAGGATAAVAAAAQLERFRASFPASAAIAPALAELSRLAQANRVALDSGDYRLNEERMLGMRRYEVRYPVKGAWRDVFIFLAAMLNEVPTLVLEEVVFKRESRAAAEVDAQLRLSLYFVDATLVPGYRAASPGLPAAPPRLRGGDG